MNSCSICKKSEPEVTFYLRKARNGKEYASTYCKECEREKARQAKKARYDDPVKGRNMKERAAERTAKPEYRLAVNEAFRNRYSTDPEFRQAILDRMQNNRMDDEKNAKIRKKASEYYRKNKDEIRAKQARRIAENPRLKIRGFMRGRISEALARFKKTKSGVSSLQYLPYSWEDLYRHLESQFEEWMNFSNYGSGPGTWQIDHIIPQSFFPYESVDSNLFKMCWDLKNLRPYDSALNAKEDDRKYLLGEPRSVFDVFREMRSSSLELRETPELVLSAGERISAVDNACPMSMVGLNYLDSVFTARFGSSTARFPSLQQAMADDRMLYEAIVHLIKKEERVTPHAVHAAIRYRVRTPGHFFPMAALSVLKRYASGRSVFDPFLGWGGRCMAALCSDVSGYVGCDLQKEVVDGCASVARAFKDRVRTEFHNCDALAFLKSSDEKFGFISILDRRLLEEPDKERLHNAFQIETRHRDG